MLHFVGTLLYGIGKWIYNKATGTKPATPDDIVKQLKEMKDEIKADREARFKKVSGDKNAEVPEDSSDAVNKATTEKAALNDQVSYSKSETTLDTVDTNLSKMERFTKGTDLNPTLEKAGTDLDNISNTLDTVTPDNLSSVMADVRSQLENLTTTVKQLNIDVKSIVSTQEQANIQKDVDEMTAVEDAVKEEKTATDNQNGEPNEDDPDAVTKDIPDEL
jgi:hypothetical protein